MFKQLSDKIEKMGGVNNVHFVIPCRTLRPVFAGLGFVDGNETPSLQPCRIVESRYKVIDDYKIQLVPFDDDFASETFYIMDLESLMQRHPEHFQLLQGNPEGVIGYFSAHGVLQYTNQIFNPYLGLPTGHQLRGPFRTAVTDMTCIYPLWQKRKRSRRLERKV